MQIAIVAAGFTPGEADRLRRAMATFKRVGTIGTFQRQDDRRHGRATAMSASSPSAASSQIEGFGEYGFPESHAASFALLVYASAWLKCRYPDVFCRRAAERASRWASTRRPRSCATRASTASRCARPTSIIRRRDSTLEPGPRAADHLHELHREMRDDIRTTQAMRLGLREIKGLRRRMGVDRERLAATRRRS